MRHLVDHRKLGRTHSERRALLRNLATSLVLHERIETTLPKAKELRRLADRLVTLAKEGTLHARRQAATILLDPGALRKLFNGLGVRFKDRPGGYTRIFKFGLRRGDAAPMAAIEYLGYQLPVREKKEEKARREKEKKKKEEKRPKVELKVEKKKVEPKKEAKKEEKKEEKKAEEKEEKKIKEKKAEPKKEGKKRLWGLFGGKGKKK